MRWRKANPDKWKALCKRYRKRHPDRVRAAYRAWVAKNIDHVREYSRKWHGLPAPTRPCPTRCECCGLPPGKKALATDHDHRTKRFRGWLCHKCNMAIGSLGDNVAGLRKAIKYLKRKRK